MTPISHLDSRSAEPLESPSEVLDELRAVAPAVYLPNPNVAAVAPVAPAGAASTAPDWFGER